MIAIAPNPPNNANIGFPLFSLISTRIGTNMNKMPAITINIFMSGISFPCFIFYVPFSTYKFLYELKMRMEVRRLADLI